MFRKPYIPSFFVAIAALLAVSCSQAVYVLDMESRGPSESGLNLQGKSLAIVYLESADGSDSLYNNRVSDALAYKLETEFYGGQEAVGVYNLTKDPNGDYASKDTLSQFIMLLDKDVIMLLDTPDIQKKAGNGSVPISSILSVYDSMSDSGIITIVGRTYASSTDDAVKKTSLIGDALASPLISSWVQEQCSLYYYSDTESKWLHAIELADEMKWKEAMEIWMELAKLKDSSKAASAKYNTAVGCYILEQYELALAWLKSSDDTCPQPLSPALRTRINSKMKKANSQ